MKLVCSVSLWHVGRFTIFQVLLLTLENFCQKCRVFSIECASEGVCVFWDVCLTHWPTHDHIRYSCSCLIIYQYPSRDHKPLWPPAGTPADIGRTSCGHSAPSSSPGAYEPSSRKLIKRGLEECLWRGPDNILLQLEHIALFMFMVVTIGKDSMNGHNLLGSWVNLYFILIIECVA